MPRKKWKYKFTTADADLENTGPIWRIANTVKEFQELDTLSGEEEEHLIQDLIRCDGFARAGLSAQKRGVSNDKLANDVFMHDVAEALKRAGIEPKRWDKQYDNGGGESFYFRFSRSLSNNLGVRKLPVDLKDTALRGVGRERMPEG